MVSAGILSCDASLRLSPWLLFNGGIEARTDTHHEVERELRWSWWDRERARPALAVRNLDATLTKGLFTLELGKQFFRWARRTS